MPLDELAATIEFAHLSPKMANWVRAYVKNYIDSGKLDPTTATKAAYDCRSDETARTFGYQLIGNPKIILALNRFFGNSPEQAFLKEVERAIYNRKLTVAQVRALELLCRVNGWANGLPRSTDIRVGAQNEPEENTAPAVPPQTSRPRFRVGDLCTQNGQTFRVTSVDANGQPLTAEEVA
jgi:hypothetical protein